MQNKNHPCSRQLYCLIIFICLSFTTHAEQPKTTQLQEVDQLILQLGLGKKSHAAIARLKTLGTSALPRLLDLLKNANKERRVMATVALRYCWNEQAQKTCIALLGDKDQRVIQMAMSTLLTHIPAEEAYRAADPYLDKMPLEYGAPIFQWLQSRERDKQRLLRVIKQKRYWPSCTPDLCLYRGKEFNSAARKMLAYGKHQVKVEAINALVFQADNNAKVKAYVTGLLKNKQAVLRERAAEYLRWLGDSKDQAPLELALKTEKDLFAHASMQLALKTIALRQKNLVATGDTPNLPSDTIGNFYQKADQAMKAQPSQNLRLAILQKLQNFESEEPQVLYGNKTVPLAPALAQISLWRQLNSYKPLPQDDFNDALTIPQNSHLLPPVPEFFDAERHSFGKLMPKNAGPFADSHHVGDDMAWFKNLTPVIAIGDGIVRLSHHSESWGGLVVIEHKLNDGKIFCSLYAHLGALIAVQPSQTIKAGEKLASLGRGYTWENGGYGAHLHFGIHSGAYNGGDWVTGYLDKEQFAKDKNWLIPQDFIKKHLPKNSPLQLRLQALKKKK